MDSTCVGFATVVVSRAPTGATTETVVVSFPGFAGATVRIGEVWGAVVATVVGPLVTSVQLPRPVVASETTSVSTGVGSRTFVTTLVTVIDALAVLGWEGSCSGDVSEEGSPCPAVSAGIGCVDWAT